MTEKDENEKLDKWDIYIILFSIALVMTLLISSRFELLIFNF